MNDLKSYFDVSILLINDQYLSTNISVGAQIIFESSFDDDLVLNDDNFCYIYEAARHFRVYTIVSDCNLYMRTHMTRGHSTESCIICQKFLKMKYALNLEIENVCKKFHELPDDELIRLATKFVYFILNQNYKFECNEYEILKIVLRWMIIYGELIININNCVRLF